MTRELQFQESGRNRAVLLLLMVLLEDEPDCCDPICDPLLHFIADTAWLRGVGWDAHPGMIRVVRVVAMWVSWMHIPRTPHEDDQDILILELELGNFEKLETARRPAASASGPGACQAAGGKKLRLS